MCTLLWKRGQAYAGDLFCYRASELGLEAQGSEELGDADRETRQGDAELDALVAAQNASRLIVQEPHDRAIGGVDEKCDLHSVVHVPQASTQQCIRALFGRD